MPRLSRKRLNRIEDHQGMTLAVYCTISDKQENKQTINTSLYIDTSISSLTIIEKSKKEDKDQESVQSNTTHDPGYQQESNKLTIRNHKREPRGQPFPSR